MLLTLWDLVGPSEELQGKGEPGQMVDSGLKGLGAVVIGGRKCYTVNNPPTPRHPQRDHPLLEVLGLWPFPGKLLPT